MATYKVLQDIEAEDKFIGPLTLKQFIFGSIAAVSAYLGFFITTKGFWWADIILFPIIVVCGFLAFPWGRDQPTEVWLLAKLHYFFKPRRRIWDQTGLQQLVKITAPQQVLEFTSNNFTETEVKSRLKALADTIDSRGWAVKNVLGNPNPSSVVATGTDRLVDAETILPQAVSKDEGGVKDIFDERATGSLDSQLAKSNLAHANDSPPAKTDTPGHFWFMGQQPAADETILPKAEEAHLSNELKARHDASNQIFRNHKSVPATHDSHSDMLPPVTATPPTDTIKRAEDNHQTSTNNDGEVVVPLH